MAAESEKPAWPLMVMAVASFVPCLGFAFASATVSWALVAPRRHARVAMVVAVVGALLNLGFAIVVGSAWLAKHPLPTPEPGSDMLVKTQQHLDLTAERIEEYRAAHGVYPDSLGQMLVPMGAPADSGHIPVDTSKIFPPVDPLSYAAGRPRLFTYVVSPDRQQYDLLSPGRDGRTPSSDDMRPMLSPEVRKRSGYQPGL